MRASRFAAREAAPAAELAAVLSFDRVAFKPRIRQLKELGLTESLAIGDRLSPRSLALVAARPQNNKEFQRLGCSTQGRGRGRAGPALTKFPLFERILLR